MQAAPAPKVPVSVLVIVHTPALEVLLLERADHPGFWQSVTGAVQSEHERLIDTALREVREETGLAACAGMVSDWQLTHRYPIYPHWRHRYASGVTHNTEHVFALCVPQPFRPLLDAAEHRCHRWLGWRDAADLCFSWTNAEAIRRLARARDA